MKITNRLKIYDLLFSYPLVNYAEDGVLNVLICGENEIALQMFKAVFWCGQHPSYELYITVHTNNSELTKKSFCNDMPALSLDSNEYATITFAESVPDFSKYNCVFICSDTFTDNVCKNMKDNTLFGQFYATNIIYSEEIGPVTKCFYNTLETDLDESNYYAKKLEQFQRIAFNIHFSYELKFNQRCGIKKATENFNNYYNYISSFAAAAHIPYKLSLCKEKALEKIIEEKSTIYNTLLALEHKRWVAYQITEGYQMPTDGQLEEYAYLNGNDHKNKLLKLHPCMCKCGNNGRILAKSDVVWNKSVKELGENFSELDIMSIKLYQIAVKRTEKIIPHIDAMFEFIEREKRKEIKSALINFRSSAKKLINDEENSIVVYENKLSRLKEIIKRYNLNRLSEKISSIEKTLSIVIQRNKREDFFANDEQSIQMLPFCLSYDFKKTTVVTISSNNLYEDAIVPTMLMPNKAIFIGENTTNQQYKKACNDYFIKRGVTTILFEKKVINTVSDAMSVLTQLKEKYKDSLVINCSGTENRNILLAIGAVCLKTVPVLTALNGKLINLNNLHIASYQDMYLTTDELLLLQGSSYNNYLNLIYLDKTDTNSIENIFWEANKRITTEKKTCNVWARISSFFSSATKAKKINFIKAPYSIPQKAQIEYKPNVFDERNIRAFLHNLNEGKIIKNLNINSTDTLVTVNFEYVDEDLINYLTDNNSFGALSFKLGKLPQYHKLEANDIVLFDSNDPLADKKLALVHMMEKENLISELNVSGNKCSFIFKTQFVKSVFATQGKILELIIYRKLQDLGLFDDVQTNVNIIWETANSFYNTIVKKEIAKIPESKIGIECYQRAQEKATKKLRAFDQKDVTSENEIDVVAIKGFSPYFISCKSGNPESMYQWVNEIAALSAHFKARPILVVGFSLNEFSTLKKAILRGSKMGVSILGAETIRDDGQFKNAVKKIIGGETVIGSAKKENTCNE